MCAQKIEEDLEQKQRGESVITLAHSNLKLLSERKRDKRNFSFFSSGLVKVVGDKWVPISKAS